MFFRYTIIYIAVFVFCAAVSVSAQEEATASDSDALANIDSFLSDGLDDVASGTAAVATEPAAPPPSDTAGGEPVTDDEAATESARPGDPAVPEGWMPLPVLPPAPRAPAAEIGKTVRPEGEGALEVVVTTVREKTPRQVSIMPDRVELWAQDRLLATLENGEPGVENAFHRRTFSFPPLTLPAGYYFLTIRGFAEGFVTRERKWKGKTVQIGIHDGKTTKLREDLSMFVW